MSSSRRDWGQGEQELLASFGGLEGIEADSLGDLLLLVANDETLLRG
jgi:hypothetical protein